LCPIRRENRCESRQRFGTGLFASEIVLLDIPVKEVADLQSRF
jgi:hypothetical protein